MYLTLLHMIRFNQIIVFVKAMFLYILSIEVFRTYIRKSFDLILMTPHEYCQWWMMSVRLGYLIASGISKGENQSAQWRVLSVNVPFVNQLNLECHLCYRKTSRDNWRLGYADQNCVKTSWRKIWERNNMSS